MTDNLPNNSAFDYYRSLGSPLLFTAPMVGFSDLAYRLLTREMGSDVTFTQMINTDQFARSKKKRGQFFEYKLLKKKNNIIHNNDKYDVQNYYINKDNLNINELNLCDYDHPLIVQFAGNNPHDFVKSAKMVEDFCEGIDINLGCPQNIARRGNYGSFLLEEDPELIGRIVKKLNENISIPISCKIRLLENIEDTWNTILILINNGCKLLTIHGRTRLEKGSHQTQVHWDQIKTLVDRIKALPDGGIPVIANGGIEYYEDIEKCIQYTGCHGVMSSEGVLENPAIFIKDPIIRYNTTIWDISFRYIELVGLYYPNWHGAKCVSGHLVRFLFQVYHILTEQRKELLRPKDYSIDNIYNIILRHKQEWEDYVENNPDVLNHLITWYHRYRYKREDNFIENKENDNDNNNDNIEIKEDENIEIGNSQLKGKVLEGELFNLFALDDDN